jgi:hypothetical protein
MKKEINGLKFVTHRSFFKNRELEAIEFFDSSVEYKYSNKKYNKKIFYKDVALVRYYREKRTGKYKGDTFYMSISDNKKNNIIINEDFDETFPKILHIVHKIIKPYLVINLLKQLDIDGKIKIGPLILTSEGLYKERIIREARFLPWRNYVGYEYGTPTAFEEKWRKFSEETWLIGYQYTPQMTIYGKHPEKEGYSLGFCLIDLDQFNTMALPDLLYILKDRYK